MKFETIIYEIKDNIGWIALNRPEVLNAKNEILRRELSTAADMAGRDDEVHVIVITGTGEKAFCAGADINMFTEWNTADAIASIKSEKREVQNVRELIKPVIAMVNGLALGGGCELALACDIIVASEKARFGLPEVSVGVIPGGGGTQVLPRLVGEKKAKELILTGDLISAEEALSLGMINKVVSHDQLRDAVEKIARKIRAKSPVILELAKIAVNKSLDTPLSAGVESEKELFAMCFGTDDQKEGARAFLEKRKPDYKGK
ncbi:MAG: enoyl-CoA hydratase-related protein [Thermodesulfobacteriota bacterium]|nr:enoyl-CoA hydratase-related protein [Thermodesulfobacteriota bacterium]